MKCRACDEPNRREASECRRCGVALVPACYGCGAAVATEGKLCIGCRTERVPTTMEPDELFPTHPQDATKISALPYELRPRFIGRESVLERLLKACDDARSLRELAFMVLLGDSGMGKTRVVQELSERLAGDHDDIRFLTGTCDSRGLAFGAFSDLLSQRFGVTVRDTPTHTQEKIIAGVSDVLPAQRVTEVAHLLAQLMRVPFQDSPVVEPLVESPQQLDTRTYIALRRFLLADASNSPLILCFENLELCGDETINLLHYLAAGLASGPVVIIATGKPTLYDKHPTFGDGDIPVDRIELGPLTKAETSELLAELCRPLEHIPPRLLSHAPKLGGSPRACFEFVRLLLEAEVIIRSGGASWRADEMKLASIRLPPAQDDLTAERLRVMADAERDLLEKASAVGETFWLDAVVALVRVAALKPEDPDGPTIAEIASVGDHTRVAVAQSLAKLVEREWILTVRESSVPGEQEYRFAYPELWVATYERIADGARRRYHRHAAQWLELRPEGRGALAQEDIGRHLERAGDADGAAMRYRRAADAARANFFNDKATRLYVRALTCVGDTDLAARMHLWHDLGSVYELTGDFDAALGAFERMLRLAWVVASRTKAAVAFNKMGRVWRRKGDLKLALEYLERGQELFTQTNDSRGIAGSLDDIGKVLYLLGRLEQARQKTLAGLTARGQGGDQRSIASSLSNLGNIQQDLGMFPESEACHKEALEIRHSIGDRVGVIASRNNLSVLAYEVGDCAAARKGWEQALSEAEEIGALPLQSLALINLGEVALSEGRNEAARSRLEDALSIAEEVDDRRIQLEALRNLALLDHCTGNTPQAQALAKRALEFARAAGLRDAEGRCMLALGEVLAANLFDEDNAGEPATERAERYYTDGVKLMREVGNESELAKGLDSFGRYKIERGDIRGGRDLLREAFTIFDRLGMKQSAEVERVLHSV